MEAFTSLLIFSQALGAFTGAITALWSEFAYVRAVKDGKIDDAERAHLRIIGHGLRWGMTLLLLSSTGLVVIAYLGKAPTQSALSDSYWILTFFALFVVGISWALARKRISFALVSALLFSAWWFLAYLTFGGFPFLSFGAAVAFFVVASTMFYIVLTTARLFLLRKS